MRRFRSFAILSLLILVTGMAEGEPAVPTVIEVLGTVTSSARPVGDALVIALDLQNLDAIRTWTGRDGTFALPALKAGIYKIIAVKQGFEPAITTLFPNRATQKLSLKLEGSRAGSGRSRTQAIWELRAMLPADVLRDLDFALEPLEESASGLPRFEGEMVSLTGVTRQASDPSFAETALGVRGRIGESWEVGVSGRVERFEDPTDDVSFGTPLAESSVMTMEVSSSPQQGYRVASARSSWMYRDSEQGQREADVRAHNFEWRRGLARVEVRYFEQENLFRAAPEGSNLIEIAGNVPIFQSNRGDLGVAMRVTQESVESTEVLRTADLSANGTVTLVPSLILHYGLATHLGVEGQELAPRTGGEWKLTEGVSLVGSAMYKVVDRGPSAAILPALVFWSEHDRVLPRYAYTLGFTTGKDGANRFSAIATVTAVDDPLRVVFADEQSQFWDGVHVDAGDIRRDLRLAWRREFGKRFALDVAGTAGTASTTERESRKIYVTGDLQSTFNPTGTTLVVSYREIQQPGEGTEEDYHTERLNLRMAQSLYLPIDIKLLLGLELARAENSPYLMDTLAGEGQTRKFIGGLALNF